MSAPPDRDLLALLGRVAVGLLLFAALVPRARTIAEPNVGDARAAAAVEGTDELPPGLAAVARWTRALAGDKERAATGLQVLALVLHLAAGLALVGLLVEAHGIAAALFALALWAGLPIAVLHGPLWGPENVGLGLGLGAGYAATRWIRAGGRAACVSACAGGLSTIVTGLPGACFVLASVAPHWRTSRGRRAVGLAVGLPLVALVFDRGGAEALLPQVGSGPLQAIGIPALLVMSLGVLLRAARGLDERARLRLDGFAVGAPPRVDLVPPLLIAGVVALRIADDASWVLLTPAVAAAGAAFFVQVARPLLALRAGLGPVVVAVGLVVVPGLAGFEHMRQAYLGEQAE